MRIKQLGDPILRETSLEVDINTICQEEIQSVIAHMKDVLNGLKSISDENGNALSAPQVGHLHRLILLRIDGEFMPMINPEITSASDEMFDFEEECFSFYNLRAMVKRHHRITVKYYNDKAEKCEVSVEGEFSGLIQHEIDHLNGVFFLDHVNASSHIASIDHILKDNPIRLQVVKEMMDYMTSE